MSERTPLSDLRIADGFTVGDLQTLDDYDEANAVLAQDIAAIEAKLDAQRDALDAGENRTGDEADWRRRAEAALKIKRAIRAIVAGRRADMVRAAKAAEAETRSAALLRIIQQRFPDAFRACLADLQSLRGEAAQ